MARMRWRLGVALVVCWSSGTAGAQVTVGTGVRAATVDAPGRDRWRANQVVASALRVERPWLTLASDGAVMRDERGVWRTAGALEAALFSAAPFGSRLAFVGSLGEPSRDSALYPSRFVAGARLSRRLVALECHSRAVGRLYLRRLASATLSPDLRIGQHTRRGVSRPTHATWANPWRRQRDGGLGRCPH